MSAGLRAVLVVIGAVLGAMLLLPAGHLLGGLVGAILVLGAAELNVIRGQLKSLEEEVKRLRHGLQRVQEPVDAAASAQASRPAHSPSPAPDTRGEPAWPRSEPLIAMPAIRWLVEFLTGGNAVVRIGIVILFFGVAFLLRYLAEHSRVPIEWRLAGIILGGVALLVIGWRLRRSRAAFALPLQGGGLGILYLTVFAALRLYALLPPSVAFPILAAIAVLSAVLAVPQNSQALAVLGVAGGFLAPVLATNGQGSHVMLFSYYALLNAGILAMAWFKAWRPLNLVGFVFTFGIGTAWGVLRYRPELFASTEPFLILYFLLYVAIALLFTLRQPVQFTGYIDAMLVFGTPIVVFTLQSTLLHDRLMPLAYSAVAMSTVYLVLAGLLRLRRAAGQALLAEAFIAIGVGLLTLTVPLALNARWNMAAWSLEAAGLIWVGCRQQRPLARLAGTVLILVCGLMAATRFDLSSGHALLPLADYAGVVLLSVAAIVAASILHRHRPHLKHYEQSFSSALFWWGLGWWLAGGASDIAQTWPAEELAGILIFLTCTAQICGAIHRRLGMASARLAALGQLPLMFMAAVIAFGSSSHPAAAAGWLGWPLAFIGLYCLMYRLEGAAQGRVAIGFNAGATWLLCGLGSWEAAFQVGRAVAGSAVWSMTAWAALPLLLLWQLPRLVTHVAWPFAKNRHAYLFVMGMGLAAFLYGWGVIANLLSTGDVSPLPYCPLLNPLDVTQAVGLLVLWRYWQFVSRIDSLGLPRMDARVTLPALAALTFLWLNAVLLRTLHQWFEVPYGWQALLASTLVQSSLSIFWALLSFLIILAAARRSLRRVWIVGATLLGVVIAKLFLVDLSRVGSIERIVSFLGVGLLMLVIGYISPLPPKNLGSTAPAS